MRAVLTFHSIDDSGSVLSFPRRRFTALIERLALTATPVLTFDELLGRPSGITLTFDDGVQSVHEHALPVLRAHSYPAHLFLTTGSVGKNNAWPSQPHAAPKFAMLDWNQIETCAMHGVLIESHTVTHPDLRTLSDAAITDECARADAEIEHRLGRRPRLFAYPYGLADHRVRRTVSSAYRGCFSTRLDYLPREPDLSDIPRLDTYFLRAPLLFERILSAPTRSYIAIRSKIRAMRGKT